AITAAFVLSLLASRFGISVKQGSTTMMDVVVRQRGQALAEGGLALLVLVILTGSAALLFRWQDMALQAAHASRALAFESVRNPHADRSSQVIHRTFHGEQRWNDRQGKSW